MHDKIISTLRLILAINLVLIFWLIYHIAEIPLSRTVKTDFNARIGDYQMPPEIVRKLDSALFVYRATAGVGRMLSITCLGGTLVTTGLSIYALLGLRSRK
jgi:hypothetical protein